jgi:hypothetical protein
MLQTREGEEEEEGTDTTTKGTTTTSRTLEVGSLLLLSLTLGNP